MTDTAAAPQRRHAPPRTPELDEQLRQRLREDHQRADVIGTALATGNLADLTPDALRWYVNRAQRLESHVTRALHAEHDAEHDTRVALFGEGYHYDPRLLSR